MFYENLSIIKEISNKMWSKRLNYSLIVDYYDDTRAPPREILVFWLSKIIELADVSEGLTILDIGCGTGLYTIPLAVVTGTVVCGLDAAKGMVKKAKEKESSHKVKWMVGDARNGPINTLSFDRIFITLVIHQIGDKKKAVDEIYRILKKNGKAVIMTKSYAQLRRSVIWDFSKIRQIDLKRFPTIPVLKKLLFSAGFKKVHRHTISRGTTRVSIDEYLEKTKKKFLSTLTLLSEEEFQKGLRIFEKKLRNKYGNDITYEDENTFVVGEKQSTE